MAERTTSNQGPLSAPGPSTTPGPNISGVGDAPPPPGADRFDPGVEIGVTGLKRVSGFVQDEFLTELVGQRGMRKYREMRDNYSVIGAAMAAIEMPMRQVEWRWERGRQDDEGKVQADFAAECLDDMSFSWHDTLSEILSMVTYGYAPHEIVYKTRSGYQPEDENAPASSRFEDGLLSWRKLPIRGQETVWRWHFGPNGGIRGLWQLSPPDYHNVYIPIQKLLLFRTRLEKNNPEGRSMLRSAYFSWYFSKRLVEMEAIAVERDATGVPVGRAPQEFFVEGASSDMKNRIAQFKQMLLNLRNDEQAALLLPDSRDAKDNYRWAVELMPSPGTRAHNTNEIIQRHDLRAVTALLCDFLLLGHDAVGSRALADPKIDFFMTALNSVLDSVADIMNRFAVPRLFRLNGLDVSKGLPRLTHDEIRAQDLEKVGTYFKNLSGAGMPLFPNPSLEKFLLELANAPTVHVTGEVDTEEISATEAEGSAAAAADPTQQRGGNVDATNTQGGQEASRRRDDAPPAEGAEENGPRKSLAAMRLNRRDRVLLAGMSPYSSDLLAGVLAAAQRIVATGRTRQALKEE